MSTSRQLVPIELEQHFAMNRARLITYEQVRDEIQAYIEARPIHFRIQDNCDKEHLRIDGGGKGGKTDKKEKGEHQNPIQARTLFVGTAVRIGRIQRICLALIKSKKEARHNRTTAHAREQARSRRTQQISGARSREKQLEDVRCRPGRSLLVSSLQRRFNAAWFEKRSGCST